jgi:hypothetical protein
MRDKLYKWCALFAVACIAQARFAFAQSLTGTILYPIEYQGSTLQAPFTSAFEGQVAFYSDPDFSSAAILWTPPNGNALNLSPAGRNFPDLYATDGAQQVGSTAPLLTNTPEAYLWNGTAASGVNLAADMPAYASTASLALAVSNGQQVGWGGPNENDTHAFLWNGTASSAVDLNPSGYNISVAFGTSGTQQVGYAAVSVNGVTPTNAFVWNGSASSGVNLNPTTFDGQTPLQSIAFGTDGDQQVGVVYFPGFTQAHAVIWSGTANSAIDLNPTNLPGIQDSVAVAINDNEEAGYGTARVLLPPGAGFEDFHALLWTGTASSAIDLETLLPSSGTWDYSQAFSIDPSGNVYGVAYGTYNGLTTTYAVEWSPVPEPASATLFGLAGIALLARRRIHQS